MKALVMFSGGLDSMLAIKLMKEQRIGVVAFHFMLPFSFNESGIRESARRLGVKLMLVKNDKGYIKMLRKPKHGFGRNMNPCIDCKIFIFREAKKAAKKIGAKIIATGEVLGERPMSQNKHALELIAKEAKTEILRPLSARLLPETKAEKSGWVDRSKLLAIQGRQRKEQLELAKKFRLKNYPLPAGGCLLTNKEYAAKISDLLDHRKYIVSDDIFLLKVGRHFRYGKSKIIVGRNYEENMALMKKKNKTDYMFEAEDVPGPVTLLQGPKTDKAINAAASLTVRYSDAKQKKVVVKYGSKKPAKQIMVKRASQKFIEGMRL
jgi:tRNA U34 2-thiouridine synthase MnmA/TrmU